MENNSRRNSYRSSSYSNSRRDGGYNRKGSSISINQLVTKTVYENLPNICIKSFFVRI